MDKPGTDLLAAIGACLDAREWTKQVANLREAWAKCQRSDWMVWALRTIGFKDDRKFRLYACGCARNTPLSDGRALWDLLTDQRSRTAIEVAERFAEGKATDEERQEARSAADAVADAAYAYAARDAAYAYAYAADAAYDAADAAYAYAARGAAYDAAYAAAYAADAAYDAADDAGYAAAYAVDAAGYAAARASARSWQADLLRQWISWDEIEPVLRAYQANKAGAKP